MPASAGSRRPALVALAAAAVVGALGGLVVALAQPVMYTATGAVSVATSARGVADRGERPPIEQQVRTAWADLATAPTVLGPVIEQLHLRTSEAALASRIDAATPDGQTVVSIGVTDPSAARAAQIANAVQDRLVAVAPALTPATPDRKQVTTLRSVLRATPPPTPSGAPPLLVVLGGMIAGLGIWVIALLVLRIARTPGPPRGRPAASML